MGEDYQVIARRWRPQSFEDLVGQEHIVRTLKNAIQTGRIAHAYLFVGPRGTGKTSTARVFAKALNAEGGPSVQPPIDSEIAKAIMSGNCMDVIEIDGASNNSVEQIRDLREECQYAPAQCTYKIYIIDEVHMLSQGAFNALLKTLEEPPSHVKFIFATTEAQKVLATITSRCQRFEFRPIASDLIIRRLQQIADAEDIKVAPEALENVARLADGGMRDAQSIFDQLISFCGSDITEQDVLDVYGLASPQQLDALLESMLEADYGTLLAKVDELAREGRDLSRLLRDLQQRVRERLLASVQERTSHTEGLLRMLDVLQERERSVQTGLNERVNFEVSLLKAVEASRTRAIDTVLRDLSRMAGELPEDSAEKKSPVTAS
ncbi:MAG: DNA polymerase III subunit gamma/tau [Puniceicoccaceae bacterium 5H]|nr:MAG: DNA polymerase III subunit gamma/tau [Puniceicoccaceae bacterium 5H]